MKALMTLLLLFTATGLWANQSESLPFEGSEMITMRIQAHKVSCQGFEGNKTCYTVQKGASIGTDFWETLEEPIDGFNFEEGFIYDVTVKIELRATPSENQSRFHYTLVKVVSKKKE